MKNERRTTDYEHPVADGPKAGTIRLLAIDLDGTLLNSKSEISPANREALAAAAARGVQVVVVTGRRFHSARPFVAQIPCPVTVISSNGARIGTVSGEAYFRDFLPAELAREALQVAREYRPYAVVLFDKPQRGQVVMQRGASPEGPIAWYLRTAADVLLEVDDLEAAAAPDPIQVLFGGPPERLAPLEGILAGSPAGPRVHLTWTKYLYRNVSILDVMNRRCSKGSALARWAGQCGIEPNEVMAIGDNHNDLEMLQFAGMPVLMANRAPGFDGDGWPVTLSNDEDGVAAAIRRYILG
ncbi:MAG TPA: HAD-IIB family hydrolase [Terriglobia bacterium]|nr:HAD-IIB family hydrolase [Terriglobia bacterium]